MSIKYKNKKSKDHPVTEITPLKPKTRPYKQTGKYKGVAAAKRAKRLLKEKDNPLVATPTPTAAAGSVTKL